MIDSFFLFSFSFSVFSVSFSFSDNKDEVDIDEDKLGETDKTGETGGIDEGIKEVFAIFRPRPTPLLRAGSSTFPRSFSLRRRRRQSCGQQRHNRYKDLGRCGVGVQQR